MFHYSDHALTHLLATNGYWAVLLFVAVESTGIPFPGETMLLAAAIYAGAHHSFHLPLVILAAAGGAILGDNLGFLVGRVGGYRLLCRYGHVVHLDERKLKLGIYLFRRHGGKVVFLGRFVAVLRAWAAFLAGTSRMPWDRFLLFNAAGGILWATLYGCGGYALGDNIYRLTGPVGVASVVLAILAIAVSFIILRRNEERLEGEAEQALPGPLTNGQLQTIALDRRVSVRPP
jgi:membrane protein DedA with SNARE-associated domain